MPLPEVSRPVLFVQLVEEMLGTVLSIVLVAFVLEHTKIMGAIDAHVHGMSIPILFVGAVVVSTFLSLLLGRGLAEWFVRKTDCYAGSFELFYVERNRISRALYLTSHGSVARLFGVAAMALYVVRRDLILSLNFVLIVWCVEHYLARRHVARMCL